jgi:hypothetical protein
VSFFLRHAGKHAPAVGTTFSVTLGEAASLMFTFSQRTTGRKAGGRCVKATKRNAHKRKCTIVSGHGSITASGEAGLNKVSFKDVVGGKKLKPGTYTVTVIAAASGDGSIGRSLTFTIVT